MKGRTKGPAHTRTRPCQIGSVEKVGVAPNLKRVGLASINLEYG